MLTLVRIRIMLNAHLQYCMQTHRYDAVLIIAGDEVKRVETKYQEGGLRLKTAIIVENHDTGVEF